MKANMKCWSKVAMVLLLAGCQSIPSQHDQPYNALNALDQAVNDLQQQNDGAPPPLPLALQLPWQNQEQAEEVPVLIDVAANGVDAQSFFASLASNGGYNVAVHPSVSGRITLNLRKVTLQDALQTVQDMYGYDVRVNNQVIQVFPSGIRTETFPVNYLLMQRNGLSLTSVSSGRISDGDSTGTSTSSDSTSTSSDSSTSSTSGTSDNSNGTFITTRTDTDFWGQLEEVLSKMIGTGPDKQVIVLPQAGLVTVRANAAELRQVQDFLELAGNNLTRQVVLEARILEVQLSDGYQQGIDWSNITATAGSLGNFSIAGAFGGSSFTGDGITSLNIQSSDFNTAINLLSTQGDVDTLSSPRVTAINNQKAVIKVGSDEYFVTNYSTTTVASSTPVISPDLELTPFFSGIALDVTPQISAQGEVLLHVHPSVTEVAEQDKTISLGEGTSITLPLARSEIRESDTLVRARSGEIVMIGGLMKTSTIENKTKVPLLGDLPLLGNLFTNVNQSTVKTELVILLRPTVVEANTWEQQLRQSRNTISQWY